MVTPETNPATSVAPSGEAVDPAGWWTEDEMLNAKPVEWTPTSAGQTSTLQTVAAAKEQLTVPATGEVVSVAPATMQDSSANLTSGDIASGLSLDPASTVAVQPATSILGLTTITQDNATVTSGKIFMNSRVHGSGWCSGTVINTTNGQQAVVTAAHCVVDPVTKETYNSFTFVPGYWEGQRPYGTWNYTALRVPAAWVNSTDVTADQAIIEFSNNASGQTLFQALGQSNGWVVFSSQARDDVRIWGWPQTSTYDGEHSVRCDGNAFAVTTATATAVTTDSGMFLCFTGGGGSGGPWMVDRWNEDLGYVYAVTSRYDPSALTVYATPFGQAFLDLVNN